VTSSNFGNVFNILIASIWLPYGPITSIQTIFQNLLYGISQIAIPWDRVDSEYLAIPRGWNTWDLLKFTLVFGPAGGVIGVCTFSLNSFYYNFRWAANTHSVRVAQTHWFLQSIPTQAFVVHFLRTAKLLFFSSRVGKGLIFSTFGIMVLGLVIPYMPFMASFLKLERPETTFLGFIAGEVVLYGLIEQLVKMGHVKLFEAWLQVKHLHHALKRILELALKKKKSMKGFYNDWEFLPKSRLANAARISPMQLFATAYLRS